MVIIGLSSKYENASSDFNSASSAKIPVIKSSTNEKTFVPEAIPVIPPTTTPAPGKRRFVPTPTTVPAIPPATPAATPGIFSETPSPKTDVNPKTRHKN